MATQAKPILSKDIAPLNGLYSPGVQSLQYWFQLMQSDSLTGGLLMLKYRKYRKLEYQIEGVVQFFFRAKFLNLVFYRRKSSNTIDKVVIFFFSSVFKYRGSFFPLSKKLLENREKVKKNQWIQQCSYSRFFLYCTLKCIT